jgi:competence protein ComEA
MPASHHPYWLLRRVDQTAVAGLALVSLAAIGTWIFLQGSMSRRMIEADRVELQSVRFQVDINRAEVPELLQLPGIGEVLAARIIESRQKDGPFAEPADLRRVRGIGPKIFERLRPFLLPMPRNTKVAGVK